MKPHIRFYNRPSFTTAMTLAGLALAAPLVSADVYYWDNDPAAGFGTAGGTWTVPTVSQWTTDGTGVAAPGASVTTAITDLLNFGNGVTGLAAGTITVSGTVDAGGLIFASGSGAATLSGGTINFDSTAATATVNNASNTISSLLTGSAGLTKTGTGSLTLNGSAVNTLTGGLSVNGGTLALTYANLNSNHLIDSGNSLSIANGTFSLTGNNTASAANVQTFNGTSLGVGTKNITLAKGALGTSVTLNLGALTTAAGSLTTINPNTAWALGTPSTRERVFITSFNGNSLPAGAVKVNVNAGLFYRAGAGGAGAARWVSVDSAGQLQGLPVGIAVLAATTNDPTLAYQFNTVDLALTTTTASSYGLVVNQGTTGRTLTLAADGTYTINGILGLGAAATTNINAGTGTSNIIIGSEKNLVINMDNAGGVTINAPIANDGSTGGTGGNASSVTIASTSPVAIGNVNLNGANTYSGGTYFSSGVLIAGSNTALGSGTVTIGGSATRLILGNAVNLANPIVINGGAGTVGTGVLNNSGTGSFTFSGPITINAIPSVAGHFATSNATPGTINLTGLITSSVQINHRNGIVVYSGGGTGFTGLLVTATARLGANNGLATTATVALGGFAAGTLDLAGFNQSLVGITKAASAATVGNSSTVSDSTLTTTGTSTFAGTIVDVISPGTRKVGLTVNGGALTLTGANTYSGNTTVSLGTLSVGVINPSNETSTVTIAATGATLDLAYAGTDTVGVLLIGATQKPDGVYGATGSVLPVIGIPEITGPGTLTVSGASAGGYSAWRTANGAGVQTLAEDHDFDGVSNGVEYFLGGSNNTTGFTALPGVVNTGGTLSITFTKAAGYSGVYGTDFFVETSSTLATGSWTNQILANVVIDGNDVKYTFPAGTINFARLKVTGP